MTSYKTMGEKEMKENYILLEGEIMYDNDDYYVYADILYNIADDKIEVDYYGHGTGPEHESVPYREYGNSLDDKIIRAILRRLHIRIYAEALDDIEYVGIPLEDGSIIVNKNTLWRKGKMLTKRTSRYTAYGEDERLMSGEVNNMIIDKAVNGNYTVQGLAHLIAYRISFASCDREHLESSITIMVRKAFPLVPMTEEMNEAYEILKAHREEVKKNRPRPAEDKKRAELKVWADAKFPNESDEFKQDKIERAITNWKRNRELMYSRRW